MFYFGMRHQIRELVRQAKVKQASTKEAKNAIEQNGKGYFNAVSKGVERKPSSADFKRTLTLPFDNTAQGMTLHLTSQKNSVPVTFDENAILKGAGKKLEVIREESFLSIPSPNTCAG